MGIFWKIEGDIRRRKEEKLGITQNLQCFYTKIAKFA